ncbi:MAG: hypothetical protein P9E88_14835 [Candidatus Competibacter sp.]|nr:hypothetical protein [Candidatus Competibacter sp.]
MAITLGALVLPSGLVWSDEDAWSPVEQALDYTLTGALVVEESVRLAGRPITLAGKRSGNFYTAWVMRGQSFLGFSSLADVRAALSEAGATFVLTLHDSRTFTVCPRRDGDGPLVVSPMPVFGDLQPTAPGSDHCYFVESIRLMEVPA